MVEHSYFARCACRHDAVRCRHDAVRRIQKSLDIAPNILTRRLTALVDAGLMERRQYCQRPPRHEYVLTERGRDFRAVLISLQIWGNKHFTPEGVSVMLVDDRTGVPAEPVLIDRLTGQPISEATHRNVPGPAAGARMRKRLGAERKEPQAKPSRTERSTATHDAQPNKQNARRRSPGSKS